MLNRGALGTLIAAALLGGEGAADAELTGRVVSALDGQPVAGVEVAWGDVRDTTDLSGRFHLTMEDRLPARASLHVLAFPAGFCDYEEPTEIGAGLEDERREIILIPGEELHSSRYSSFLSLFRSLTATGRPREQLAEDVTLIWRRSFHGTRILRWRSFPLAVAWDKEAPGGERERDLLRLAMAEWEEKTGLDLFHEISAPEAHLWVNFAGKDSWTRFGPPGPGGEPLHARINVSPEGKDAEVISWAEHELGHALLLLGHSRDPAHVMFGGGVRGQRVSDDEARVVRVLLGLPEGENVEHHQWPPDELPREEGSDRAVVVAAGFLLIMILLAMEASAR